MKFTKATALTLAAVPALAQIPPTEFGFPTAPNNTVLNIGYGEDSITTTFTGVAPGALYGIGVPERLPTFSVNTTAYQSLGEYNGEYLVIMVDPDAPSPQDPSARFIVHFLQTSLGQVQDATVTGQRLSNNSEPTVPYMRPQPPPTSSAHRYIFYAFHQPANFAIPEAWAGIGAENNTMFNLTNFIADTNLGEPVAANYFYCSNQTGVDPFFVAAPGGSFPGGNGEAVTATSSVMTASATGTAAGGAANSATSMAGAAGAKVTGVSGLIGAGLLGLAAVL